MEVSPVVAHVPVVNSNTQEVPSNVRLAQRGKELYQTDQFTAAAMAWRQAAQAFSAQGDALNQAMALSNLSLTYQQLGQWSEAALALNKSMHLLQLRQNQNASKEHLKILAATLDIQGRLYLTQGQTEKALDTWQQAATTYAKVDNVTGQTQSLINQAQALQALGFYRRAGNMLRQVNQTLQSQPSSLIKATGLCSLGNVVRALGDLEQSRQILQQSLLVAQQVQSAQAISDAWLSLGNTAVTQRDIQAAINFYQQAATTSVSPITRIQAQLNELRLLVEKEQLSAVPPLVSQIQAQLPDLPPSRKTVYARINFAQSLMKLGARGSRAEISAPVTNPSSIAQLLVTAVQQARNLGDQPATSYALGNLGALYEQTRQLSDAQNLTEQALFIAQSIHASEIAYRWQWQLGRLLKAQGNVKGAIAAYTESVNNLKSLRSDLVAINPDIQFSFRDEVEPVYRQLVDLLLQSVGGFQPSQENLIQARSVIESLQLAELDNFFRSACLQGKTLLIDQVVDQDDPTAAVIYPIILADRLEVILKLPAQEKLRHYVTNKSQSEVESTLEKLRQYLKQPDRTNDVKNLSKQVYNWLIQPLEADLGKTQIKTLVFVLDGSLRNIPMAVLYDDKQKQYLVEKYAIALTPGLSLLEPKPLQRERLSALTAGLGEKRAVEGREFAQLENVRLELEQIEAEMPRSKALFNQAFTRTNLQNQINSGHFSVVHLATHAKFSSNLKETFVLTWNQLLKIEDLDNLLRIREVSGRFSTIELLVLSACETAAGDKRAALGLAGVAVRAGARSTVATLWQVDDRATAKLMIQFYRELFTNKLTKAEALQRAQIALLTNYHDENYKSPYYWAPYVLLGNWF